MSQARIDKKYGSNQKPKELPAQKSPIAHNFNPNGGAADQQNQSNYGTGTHLGDNLNASKRGGLQNADAGSVRSKMTSASKRSKKASAPKMVSFREKREIERVMANSHMGPGAHDFGKPFGSDLQNINFGSKIKFKADKNPGPGQYEPGKAVKLVHPTSFEPFIKDGRKQSVAEPNPDAGQYDPHKKFGDIPQKMTWQGKYKFKPDSNPPPGYYDPERAEELVRPKSASYRQSAQKRSKQVACENPDAGQYEPHKNFGDIPQKMTWQGKYKFNPNSNPPPGYYDPNVSFTKPNSRVASIKEDSGYKIAKENPPDAGQYDPHKNFGDIPQKMTWQGKYKFQPDSNPPPGLYDPIDSQTKSKSPSAKIMKERKKDHFADYKNAPAPGEYDGHIIPFGQDLKNKMTWQGKYEFKPDSNPPPGLYNADVALAKSSLPRVKSAHIKTKYVNERPKEQGPSPGDYDSHLKPFGDIPQKMTWQGKYKFQPDSNPPPGLYDPDKASSLTKPRSSSFSPSKQAREKKIQNDVPEGGQYDPDKTVFGQLPQKMTLGGPYQWKPSDTPGPGTYDEDKSKDKIKSCSPSARMHQPLVSAKREEQPGPQVYDGHLKPFGKDVNDRAVWGGKYKFQINDVPPPGYYDPERADPLVRERSPAARIDQDTMVPLEAYEDPIAVYKSKKKSDFEQESEGTPLPQRNVPRQMEDSTKSGSPLKQVVAS